MYLKSWIQKILQSLQNFLESRFKIEGLHQEPKTKIHLKSPGGILVLGFLVWEKNAFRMHSSISSVDAKVAKVANIYIYTVYLYNTSSAAQGVGGSFKNRKPIGEVGFVSHGCQSEATDGPTGDWGLLSFCLSLSLSLFLFLWLSTYLPTYLCIYLSIYPSIYPSSYLAI